MSDETVSADATPEPTDENTTVSVLQRMSGGNAGSANSEPTKPGEVALGLAVLAVGAIALWLVGSWLFRMIFGGSGLLYELVSCAVVIAILATGLGLLLPLPIFLGSRLVALVAGLLLLFFAVPFSQSLRTPDQVAQEERSGNTEKPDANAGPSDTTVIAGAQIAIKNRAVDPESVRFRNVRAYRQASGTKAVCGEFNAKNRTGGYNGFERFVSAGVDQHTWIESEVADFNAAWTSVCHP